MCRSAGSNQEKTFVRSIVVCCCTPAASLYQDACGWYPARGSSVIVCAAFSFLFLLRVAVEVEKNVMFLGLVEHLLWIPVIIAWSMCLYITFASREGVRWFSVRHNPYLIALAVGGPTVWQLGLSRPSNFSVTMATGFYSFYAMLVTAQHWHFQEWRYILAVNTPLSILLVWSVFG